MSCELRLEALADRLGAVASINVTKQATRTCKVIAEVPPARQYAFTFGTGAGYALPLPQLWVVLPAVEVLVVLERLHVGKAKRDDLGRRVPAAVLLRHDLGVGLA